MTTKLMRALEGDTVRVALITGHTIVITEEPCEVPAVFQIEARKLGAVFCKDGDTATKVEPPVAPNATSDETDRIKAALILMLERNEEDDFTGAGQPNLRSVRALCGFNAERDDVYNVFAALKEEVAANGGKASADLT